MGALIRFFTKILDICKLVPMLPVVVIAAIQIGRASCRERVFRAV